MSERVVLAGTQLTHRSGDHRLVADTVLEVVDDQSLQIRLTRGHQEWIYDLPYDQRSELADYFERVAEMLRLHK